MGRSPCCDKIGLKKGPWTPEEDQKLLAYIEEHGHGSWRALPSKAGLQRCGKSCRLRWTNYLRPDIKRGKFTLQEEQTIIQLHALLGNRWSAIATHLSKRTDNEIKNYWNTHLKKRLAKMGIDPVTHKPKNDALLSNGHGQSKHAANLNHMAQWESARLEAEARLVRQSKLHSNSFSNPLDSMEFSPSTPLTHKPIGVVPPCCFDILKGWNGAWDRKETAGSRSVVGIGADLESPTSTLSYSENQPSGMRENSAAFIEFVGNSSERGIMKEEGEENWKGLESSNNLTEYKDGMEDTISFTWPPETLRPNSDQVASGNVVQRFTDLLLNNSGDQRRFSEGCGESDNGEESGSEYLEDNKNYWNSILNLLNSSPSNSPVF